MRRIVVAIIVGLAAAVVAPAAGASVLRVGTYKGIPGQFSSIQAAVDAAKPGDWILVGPGDYKTTQALTVRGRSALTAGVLITKARLRLRGMNRNAVVVDGTKPGSARCSRKASDQNFGPAGRKRPKGLNGILIWKARNVWVQNMTVCNFLGGSGDTGNEVWWNGGDHSGVIGGWGFYGSYLNATSTFYKNEKTAAKYGIFSSNWHGGTWDQVYASNFNDSDLYIGACQLQCFQTVDHAWAQYSALGYSGTNSGGPLLVEHSRFDHNEEGFDSNSQNNTDWPSPQSGACPAGVKPQIPGAHSCWIFYANYVHDNNNPDVPSAGAAAAAPVGTGLSLEGRTDTVMNNLFQNNGAWGAAFQPYPDIETPPANARHCVGGISHFSFGGLHIRCLYDDWNNALIGNTFTHDGFFGNPTNGDFAESTLTPGHPINCYSANKDTSGKLTSSPASLEGTNGQCGPTQSSPDVNLAYVVQSLCDTQVFGPKKTPCPRGAFYPRRKRVIMHPLPTGLKTMPNPCGGVPANPWCPSRKH